MRCLHHCIINSWTKSMVYLLIY
uniref:Uncharacterized protein n=1 Tax=Rhizophora mucronata TaxID=61149 RepID=A0A2P2N6I4_RHIMU